MDKVRTEFERAALGMTDIDPSKAIYVVDEVTEQPVDMTHPDT